MRIIFLSKRQYMQKDVIDDRYARLYELPSQLARRGHQVLGVCLSYRRREEGSYIHFQDEGLLEWQSFNLGYFVFPGLVKYLGNLLALVKAFKPGVLVGGSDCLHVIITAWVARRLGIPFFIDLYDNYESFGLAKLPGIKKRYRWALQQAAGVACVSSILSEYIAENYNGRVLTLESTIDPLLFQGKEKEQARRRLNLPAKAKLIGVAGSLNKKRGIALLYDAFIKLAEQSADLYLVLAGPIDNSCPPPEHERVLYLGLLAHDRMPDFYSALDVATICMVDSEFGRFAFPQKTYEIMACRTPLVTASIGALERTLADYPQCLYQAENQTDFMQKIVSQLHHPIVPALPIPSWEDQAVLLESMILAR